MTPSARARCVAAVVALYRVLLLAYPAPFRHRFGAEMLHLVRRKAAEHATASGLTGIAAFTIHLVHDWFTTALEERLTPSGKARIMRTLVGALCVFTAAAAAWLVVMETVLHHPAYAQRIVIDTLIGIQSVATLSMIGRVRGRAARTAAGVGAAALFLIGLQAVRSNLTGTHFEGFAVVIGAALVIQGAITLWLMTRAATVRPATAA